MKRAAIIFLALVLLLSVTACGSKSIVGTWAFGVNTYEFKEDNTVSISLNGVLNYDGTYEVKDDKIALSVSGLVGSKDVEFTYVCKGDELTLSGDVMLSGASVDLTFTKQ